jgi:hypothetical protein
LKHFAACPKAARFFTAANGKSRKLLAMHAFHQMVRFSGFNRVKSN